jgi:hypothetical protein
VGLSIVLENGRLRIRDAMPWTDEPTEIVHFWPTRFDVHDLMNHATGIQDDPAEIRVERIPNGFTLRFPRHNFWCDCIGNRSAVRVETVPVERPKVRKGIELKWRYGKWQKLLKTGWQDV